MESFLHDLVTTSTAQDHEYQVLVHNHAGFSTLADSFETANGTMTITRVGMLGRLVFTPISPSFPLVLKRVIHEFQPDILHLHLPNPSAFWVMAIAEAKKIPWVVHWHADVVASDHSWGLRLAYRFYRPFEQRLLCRASKIIATSEAYLESSDPLAVWRDKTQVISLGLKPDWLDLPEPTRGEHFFTDGQCLKVLAVGRLTYYKGFQYLIQAMVNSTNIELIIVGTGDEQKNLQTLIWKLGLQDVITLYGSATGSQLRGLLHACDLVCLPSIERTEAFGVILMEAMYCQKATVISDVEGSGMGWVVEHKKTGLKVKPTDISALAEALTYLEVHRDECREMGINGRKRFDDFLRIDHVQAKITVLYEQLSTTAPAVN